ncbi:glycosyltransferase family 4 protein [Acinetobacter indicus]|uniref:glycosyltransferase family 4 protein n=1 Tax=Acinetobacter indicus TaxID=756892 RepID=UPI000CEC020B|nr:glycosyltransferase family 4 protein [Acinetobacter indicus]
MNQNKLGSKTKVDLIFFGELCALTGASTVIRNILNGFLSSDKVEMKAWSLDTNGKEKYESNNIGDQNTKVDKKISFKSRILNLLKQLARHSGFFSLILVWLLYFKFAKKVVGKYQGDGEVLFFHEIFTPFIFKIRRKKQWFNKNKVVVLHCDGDPLKMLFGYYPMLKKSYMCRQIFNYILHSIFKDVSQIVLLGENSRKRFISLYPEYSIKTIVIENGLQQVKTQTYEKNQNLKLKLITVGTVCERKGHDLLIDAILLLDEGERRKFELKIIGDGEIRECLEEKCKKEGLDNVIFHGSSNNVLPYLRESNVFILASRDEGLPMALLEAMQERLPLIATNVGDCSDLIVNNGWLIEPSIYSVAEGIKKAINCEDLKQLGENSYCLFQQKYTVESMIEKYENVLG